MSAEPQEIPYICPIHKIEYVGQKREGFEADLFNALLNASISESFRLYKEVKHGCHCPTNYKAFDTIIQPQGSKAPAQSEQ